MSMRRASGHLYACDPLLLQPEYPIFDEGIRLGRDSECCSIILSREFVSRRHCEIAREDGGLVLTDLGTTNGTYVNRTKVRRHVLAEGDRISLGQAQPFQFVFSTRAGRPRQELILPAKPVYYVGRGMENDLPLLRDPMVSSRHFRIRIAGGKLFLDDTGSVNGTFVNGMPVRTAEINLGDEVCAGSTTLTFRLDADGLHVGQTEQRNQLKLEARGLIRVHRSTPLLRGVNLVAEPGEYIGVLGPSGAGKSTLLNALNGFAPAQGGQVLMGGNSLYQCYDRFRNAIGYVPQDDIIHRDLTVERSLLYTARLRLPRDISGPQLQEHVTSVIETLGLQHVRTNPVSRLSGGQRKRVSIGCELLTRPSILFLDEPTSGLDPSTEEKLMRYFGQMAEQGQTVILTTHILYNLDLLNLVAIMARGRLVFFGPVKEVCPFFSSSERPVSRPIEVFDVLEPEARDGDSRDAAAERFEQKYLHSPLFTEFVERRMSGPVERGEPAAVHSASPGGSKRRGLFSALKRLFDARQWGILTKRLFDLKLAVPSRLAVPLLTAVLLGILTGTIKVSDQAQLEKKRAAYEKAATALDLLDRPGSVPTKEEILQMRFEGIGALPIPMSIPLIMVMTAVFLGTLSACLEISGERPVYQRERAVNLQIPLYILSKLPYLFLLTLAQCYLYVLIASALLGITEVDITWMVIVLSEVAWASCAIGLFLSSLDPTAGSNSVVLAVIAVLPQMAFCGALGPGFYHGMGSVSKALSTVLPARWGFEAMLSALYESPKWASSFITGTAEGQMGFQFGHAVFLRNGSALFAIGAAFLCATWISLKRYDQL